MHENFRPARIVIASACAVLLLHSPARAGESQGRGSRRVAPGVWGGDHVRMVIGERGAQVEFDCATGTIEGPFLLHTDETFNVVGSYTPERGGPRRDGQPVAARAHYVGRVRGNAMTLTVRLDADQKGIGAFTLTRGNDPLLTKCR